MSCWCYCSLGSELASSQQEWIKEEARDVKQKFDKNWAPAQKTSFAKPRMFRICVRKNIGLTLEKVGQASPS